MASVLEDPNLRPRLDESFYSLDEEESAFFKKLTGIEDDEELKRHIIDVQKKAYEVYGYPCIKWFHFTKLKISRLPAYPQVVQHRLLHENSLLLDIGCCFGNDSRKAAFDGWPARNIIACDLKQGETLLSLQFQVDTITSLNTEFWDYGHELFRSTPETFPATFIAGDAFDPSMITPRDPFYDIPQSEIPDIRSLRSLTPLQGHIAAIHASALFHLFSEEKQLELARHLASLLSPVPGSTIFGAHVGRPVKGLRPDNVQRTDMFCHSPESWREMWDGVVFRLGTVRVEATVERVDRPEYLPGAEPFYLMEWSVTRI